jgi:hypothetical protein
MHRGARTPACRVGTHADASFAHFRHNTPYRTATVRKPVPFADFFTAPKGVAAFREI